MPLGRLHKIFSPCRRQQGGWMGGLPSCQPCGPLQSRRTAPEASLLCHTVVSSRQTLSRMSRKLRPPQGPYFTNCKPQQSFGALVQKQCIIILHHGVSLLWQHVSFARMIPIACETAHNKQNWWSTTVAYRCNIRRAPVPLKVYSTLWCWFSDWSSWPKLHTAFISALGCLSIHEISYNYNIIWCCCPTHQYELCAILMHVRD